MPSKRKPPKPTPGELEILEILWTLGPSTVRGVYEALLKRRPMGYTGVLKLMQIMAEKGLVDRNEAQRAHVYKPRVPQQETRQTLLDHLVDRAFGGSAAQLVMQAFSSKKVSREELAEIRRILDEFEGGAQ